MKLTVTTFLSVDGVMQGPGGPEEDRSGGFTRGGWVVPHLDPDAGRFMNEVFEQVDAVLLVRRTYDIFAASWPNATDPDDPVASRLTTLPKYVASTTLAAPEWGPTTVLSGDVPAAVAELKRQPGRELQVHGSGGPVRTLHEHDLVDEHRLLVFPVIVGEGRRLFPDRGVATGPTLVDSRTTARAWPSMCTGRPAAPSSARSSCDVAVPAVRQTPPRIRHRTGKLSCRRRVDV